MTYSSTRFDSIDRQSIIRDFCGAEPGVYANRFMTLSADLVVRSFDTVITWPLDRYNERVGATERVEITQTSYQIEPNGKITPLGTVVLCDSTYENRQFVVVPIDTLVLFEDHFMGVELPLRRDLELTEVNKAVGHLRVTKEQGESEFGLFPMYSVKHNENELFFLAMDIEDTLKTDVVYIKSSWVKDQYGLKVGDGFVDIRARRKNITWWTNYHQHTYVEVEGSHISYEIEGDAHIPEDADFENLKFSENDIKEWKITGLFWRPFKG